MDIKAEIWLDRRRLKKSGKYPVKLKITYGVNRKYFPFLAKYDQTENDFNKEIFKKKPNGEFKKIQDYLNSERKRAESIIEKLGNGFSIGMFEKLFFSDIADSSTRDLFKIMIVRANELRENDQISTAVLCECAEKSLKVFAGKNKLDIDQVDAKFLTKYEKWMLENGNSKTTIGIYLRNVRTVYREAAGKGIVPVELYPFGEGKGKYVIPTSVKVKKALSLEHIAAIFNYQPESDNEQKARDFFIFSYLGNGLNLKDIALLRHKNIKRNDKGKLIIEFERAKTQRANKDKPIIISFIINEDLQEIINRQGAKSISPDNYLFPILVSGMNAEEIYKKVQLFVRLVNDNIQRIAKKLDIEIGSNITTYFARHSFSTVLINSGKTIEFVSQALGHSNIKTTQNYFAGFFDDSKEDQSDKLLPFKKEKTA